MKAKKIRVPGEHNAPLVSLSLPTHLVNVIDPLIVLVKRDNNVIGNLPVIHQLIDLTGTVIGKDLILIEVAEGTINDVVDLSEGILELREGCDIHVLVIAVLIDDPFQDRDHLGLIGLIQDSPSDGELGNSVVLDPRDNVRAVDEEVEAERDAVMLEHVVHGGQAILRVGLITHAAEVVVDLGDQGIEIRGLHIPSSILLQLSKVTIISS